MHEVEKGLNIDTLCATERIIIYNNRFLILKGLCGDKKGVFARELY